MDRENYFRNTLEQARRTLARGKIAAARNIVNSAGWAADTPERAASLREVQAAVEQAYAASVKRKPHSDRDGYIASRLGPLGWVVLCLSEPQRLDAEGKYAVTCEAHSSIGYAASVPKGRAMMRDPSSFCVECRAASGECEP